jgi:hypothetical protein
MTIKVVQKIPRKMAPEPKISGHRLCLRGLETVRSYPALAFKHGGFLVVESCSVFQERLKASDLIYRQG